MAEEEIHEGYRPVTFWIDEDELITGGMVIVEVVDSEMQNRYLKSIDLGESTVWQQIGWLETVTERIKGKVRR